MKNYRKFVKYLLLVCCVINIPSATGNSIAGGEKKINILFLMGDQHRGDRIGADGATWIKTPQLDKLAGKEYFLLKPILLFHPVCQPAQLF